MREGSRATSAVSAAEEPIVFVIDDDPLTHGALSSLFRSIGLRVEAFASATEFLQHELPAVPSCLVLDIRLPRLSGFDLQVELSRLGIKMPVIFITGHGDIPMSVKAMKSGAVDFLTKPFREQEMLDAVTAALEGDRKRRSEEKSHSDVQARFASLTPRERQIMALVTSGLRIGNAHGMCAPPRRPRPPARPAARRHAGQRHWRWGGTGVSGWGRGAPQGGPGGQPRDGRRRTAGGLTWRP